MELCNCSIVSPRTIWLLDFSHLCLLSVGYWSIVMRQSSRHQRNERTDFVLERPLYRPGSYLGFWVDLEELITRRKRSTTATAKYELATSFLNFLAKQAVPLSKTTFTDPFKLHNPGSSTNFYFQKVSITLHTVTPHVIPQALLTRKQKLCVSICSLNQNATFDLMSTEPREQCDVSHCRCFMILHVHALQWGSGVMSQELVPYPKPFQPFFVKHIS